jgi:GH15 family glucan-1,4-alpha-glucosidase
MELAAEAQRLTARAAGPDFHAIGDYGFLSDCHTGALVASDETVEWLCLPRFDSPSIFAALLDRAAGAFRVGPRGLRAPVARRYVPGTNVLETSWMTETGWFVVRDALALAPSGDEGDGVHMHARELGPHDAEHLLIRTVECVHGRVEIETVCEPAFDYATEEARWTLVDRDALAASLFVCSETSRSRSTDRSPAARECWRRETGASRAFPGARS